MTDNEIIKALECCPQHTECCYCNSLEECGNKRILTSSVLALINRQQAKIDRLEIYHRENPLELALLADELTEKLKTAKSEAVKEFAERLKKCIYRGGVLPTMEDEFIIEIDNLVKEMVGDNNA